MKETPAEWYARLCSRDGILRELASRHVDGMLPDSPARAQLKRARLIESYRGLLNKYPGSHWRLTDAGVIEAAKLK